MKKIYVSPAVMHISTESSRMICSSNIYSVSNGTTIGANTDQDQYGNDDWVNQGHTDNSTVVGGFPVVSGDGDDGEMESRGKGWSGWDFLW